jgi:hypothetical protein
MKKYLKTVNNAPTDKQMDDLCRRVALKRAKNRSELTQDGLSTLQWHHILHKPNHRLRWDLSNIIILTMEEHARYHYYEKKVAYDADSERICRDMMDKFLKVRGTTRENLEMLKRQSGGVNKICLKILLEQQLKEFEA